jgi:hypothetical protein
MCFLQHELIIQKNLFRTNSKKKIDTEMEIELQTDM